MKPRYICRKVPMTFEEAEKVVLNAKIARTFRSTTRRREHRLYSCRQCQAWHVSSHPNRYLNGDTGETQAENRETA
jgi:hypothetical protein